MTNVPAPHPAVPAVSVVAPLYNERETIGELVQRIAATLEKRGSSFEIVLVDDGSTDGSGEVLARLEEADPRVRVLRLSGNHGQSLALCRGIFEARGRVVVTMDGDLQNPPEEIPRLLDALEPGVDLVTGFRAMRHEATWRYLASRFVHWLARLLVGVGIRDFGGQFKAYRREVVNATRAAWRPGRPFFALAVWLGFRVAEVSVRHDPRRAGQSRYDLRSLARLNYEIVSTFLALRVTGRNGAGAPVRDGGRRAG